MRRITTLMLIGGLFLCVLPHAYSWHPQVITQIVFRENSSTYFVDSQIKTMDAKCQKIDGSLYIVAKYLVESLDGFVSWNQSTKTVSYECRGHRISLKVGDSNAKVDGRTVSLGGNLKATIVGGRTLIPLRFAGESLGGEVFWAGEKKEAMLMFKKVILQNLIFLHHSCGANLISQGNVRGLIKKYNKTTGSQKIEFQFWDHGYNGDGMYNPKGEWVDRNYNVPDDNTNPDGFANIFSQKLSDTPNNCFSRLMTHDVIIFKSCYPVSNIESSEMLQEYKNHYIKIRDVTDRYPNKVFIIVTQPPLLPEETSLENANRARAWANWLKSEEYLAGHKNLFTFDWFDLLADNNPKSANFNRLKTIYKIGDYDSHPNERANKETAPKFVDFVIKRCAMFE